MVKGHGCEDWFILERAAAETETDRHSGLCFPSYLSISVTCFAVAPHNSTGSTVCRGRVKERDCSSLYYNYTS